MVIFLTILAMLIGINAAIMFSSLRKAKSNTRNTVSPVSKLSNAIIYPIDLIAQEFKKAV